MTEVIAVVKEVTTLPVVSALETDAQAIVNNGGAVELYPVSQIESRVLASTAILGSIAELEDVTAGQFADGTQILVKSYHGDGKSGGGTFLYDENSTETADRIRVFQSGRGAPGRFIRNDIGTGLKVSQAGIVSSSSLDQGVLFQAAIVVAMQQEIALEIDIEDINCGGRSIWFNKDGEESSDSTTPVFTMFCNMRRIPEIRKGWFTFGKFYAFDVSGPDQTPYYTLDRNPMIGLDLRNLTFRGVVRFVNCESAMSVENVTVLQDGGTDFYQTVPTDWGQNMSGRNDEDGNPVATVAYTKATHLVEAINCNHPNFRGFNVQGGSNVTNSASETLGGVLASGCINPRFEGGLLGTQCNEAIRFESHPIYGGTNNKNAVLVNVHFEDVETYGAYINHLQGGYFNGYFNTGYAWPGTEAFFHITSTSFAESITIDGSLVGRDDMLNSTAVDIRGGSGHKVAGIIKDFGLGVQMRDGTNMGPIVAEFNNVTQDIEYRAEAKPYVRPDSPANESAVSSARTLRRVIDNFTGYALDATKWRAFTGTGASQAVAEGGLAITYPAGSPYNATKGFKIASAPRFKPADGRVSFESAFTTDTTALITFVGLIDNPADDDVPANMGSGDAISVESGTNWAGFLYSPQATTDVIYCITRNDGGTATAFGTTLTQTSLAPLRDLRVDIDTGGNAAFYADGILLTAVSGAVDADVALSASMSGYCRSATGAVLTLDRVTAEQAVGG